MISRPSHALCDPPSKVRKENPKMAIGPMQKILSDMWKALGEEEVARFNQVMIMLVSW